MIETQKFRRGILVSLRDEGDNVHLSLDDVVQHGTTPIIWKQDRHVTSRVYSRKTLEELSFADDELVEMAYYIVARLRAAKKVYG